MEGRLRRHALGGTLMVAVVLVSGSAAPAVALASIHTGFTSEREFDLAPGVHHVRGSVLVNQGARRDVSVVSIDAQHAGFELRASQAGDSASRRETAVDQALAYSQDGRRVVATVNGSLFSYIGDGTAYSGLGLGFNVSDGELINAGRLGRPGPSAAFAINEQGEPMIGAPDPVISLTLPSAAVVTIDRINQKRQPGKTVLYTPKMGAQTLTDSLGDEYVIEGFDLPLAPAGSYSGTVVAVRDSLGGTPIEPDQVVLSVSDTAPVWPATLSVGDTVSVEVSVADGWQSVSQSVGGRDLLVADGQSVTVEPDVDGAHPRTAVGIRADQSVFFITAATEDLTNGLKLPDLAELMISLGAVDALNLDGGGSTQMAVREPGDFEVSPLTPPELDFYRPVSNAVQVVSTLPTGPLASLVVAPERATVATEAPITLTAKGRDDAFNGVALDGASLDWRVRPAEGGPPTGPESLPTPTSATFILDDAGDHVVTVDSGELRATALLTAAVDLTPPTVTSLTAHLPQAWTVGLDSASLALGWTVHDDIAVGDVELQRKIGAQAWQPVAINPPSAISATIEDGYGETFRFRVRASDGAGNLSAWVTSPRYKLRLINDTASRIETTGIWKRRNSISAIRGQFVRTRLAGATMGFAFEGLQLAVIGNRGPTLGQAEIAIGDDLATLSEHAVDRLMRQVLFASPLSETAAASDFVLTTGTGGPEGGFEIDAFVLLQLAV